MPRYDIFFYSIVFFLAGVLLMNLGLNFFFILTAAVLLAAIFFVFLHIRSG